MSSEEFSLSDLDSCWEYHKFYLLSILNGVYGVEEAKDDLRGLIGSQYDTRENQNESSK